MAWSFFVLARGCPPSPRHRARAGQTIPCPPYVVRPHWPMGPAQGDHAALLPRHRSSRTDGRRRVLCHLSQLSIGIRARAPSALHRTVAAASVRDPSRGKQWPSDGGRRDEVAARRCGARFRPRLETTTLGERRTSAQRERCGGLTPTACPHRCRCQRHFFLAQRRAKSDIRGRTEVRHGR